MLFCKYDDLSVESADNGFHIRLSDKDGGMELDARAVILDGESSGGAYQRLMKLMRIKADADGFSRKNAYYLFPSLTSRAGIYSITRTPHPEARMRCGSRYGSSCRAYDVIC